MRAKTRVVRGPVRARRPTARKEPKQARSRAMVDAILDAAAQVLRKTGYDDATTNHVAEVAGVSVGSLYQYFPNKQALVDALIVRHDAAMWAAFTTHATAAIGRSFTETVYAVIDALFAAHLVDPDLHRALHQQVPRAGAHAVLAETTRRSRALVEDILRARSGQLGEVEDVPMAALVIVEAVEALIHASIALPRARAELLRVHAAKLVLRYLGVPEP